MSTRVAPLVATVHVAAPVGAVWRLLVQQDLMSRWSPETWRQWFIPSRNIRRGTISFNLNKRGWFVWPTLSRYTRVAAHEELSFFVVGPDASWTYRLSDAGDSTKIELRRDLFWGGPSILSRLIATLFLGGVRGHDDELDAGMHTTLARIKAELEV